MLHTYKSRSIIHKREAWNYKIRWSIISLISGDDYRLRLWARGSRQDKEEEKEEKVQEEGEQLVLVRLGVGLRIGGEGKTERFSIPTEIPES